MQRFQRGSFQRRTEKLTGTARYGRIGMVFHVNLNGKSKRCSGRDPLSFCRGETSLDSTGTRMSCVPPRKQHTQYGSPAMTPIGVVLEAHRGVLHPVLLRQGVTVDERVILGVDDHQRHPHPRQVVGRVNVVVELLIGRSATWKPNTSHKIMAFHGGGA